MLKIKSLEAKNFLSFEHFRFEFPQSGIYFIEGQNFDEGGSNGAGKSAIFEALIWLLYNRTIRNSNSASVQRKGTNSTEVRGVFITPDGEHTIVRRRGNKKELFYDELPISDENLEKWIGMKYEELTNSVVFGQGVVKTFTNSTDTERKDILMKILGIELYEKAAEVSRKKVKEVEIEEMREENNISNLKTKLEMLKREEINLQQEIETKIEKLNELEEKILKSKEQKTIEHLKETEKFLQEKLKEAEDSHIDSVQIVSSLLSKKNILTEQLTKIEKQIETVQNLKGNCPVCFRKVTSETRDNAIAHIEKERKKITEEFEKIEKEHKKAHEALKFWSNEKDKAKTELENIQRKIKEVQLSEMQEREIIAMKNLLTEEIEDRKKKLETLLSVEMMKLNSELEEGEKKLEELRRKKKLYQFWAEGFGSKGLVNMIFKPAVELLEMRTNYYLSRFTTGITVKIDTKTELKSGKIVEKLSILVLNKNGADAYENSSGGEKKRIDLTVVLALRDLVRWSGSGKVFDLFVADEIFDSVDEIGAGKICSLLGEFASLVYVISHNEDLKKYFPLSICVKKVDGVSKIEL